MHVTYGHVHSVCLISRKSPRAALCDRPVLPCSALALKNAPIVLLKTKVRPQRRHTLPLATKGELVHKPEFLPGRGRRTSLFGTAYDPAALFLK